MRDTVRLLALFLSSLLLHVDALRADRIFLSRRANSTKTPAPIVVPPSQYFEGIDGSWSTFNVRIGTPAQSVRVLISTNSPNTLVVLPAGCTSDALPAGVPSNCAFARGGAFDNNASASWRDQGFFGINGGSHGFEANLGVHMNADYGLDFVGLGYQAGSDAPTLENQTVAAYALPSPYYMGMFGLGTQPQIYQTFGNYSVPSFFQTLRLKNLIPSLSWSYTAGASYRLSSGQFGQLIFGGYDTSRYGTDTVSIPLNADVTRDLVASIQSISYSGATTIALLPSPIYAFIDSSTPFFYLPEAACDLFESAFGLTYNETTALYIINGTQYASLSVANPSVAFRIGASTSGGSTVSISLPFNAFALNASYPMITDQNSTYYFPLRKAANDTQYTLGRTFLQEAYLTVDYDRKNFSVSQCTWDHAAASSIVAIASTDGPASKSSSDHHTAVIAASTVVAILVVVSILAGIFFYHRRTQRKRSEMEQARNADAIALRAMTIDAKAQSLTSPTPSSPGMQEKVDAAPAATAFGATVEKLADGGSGENMATHRDPESESPPVPYSTIHPDCKAPHPPGPHPSGAYGNGTIMSNISAGSSGSGTLANETLTHPLGWTVQAMTAGAAAPMELNDSNHPVEIDSHGPPVEIDTFSGEGRLEGPAELESHGTRARPFSYEGSQNASGEDTLRTVTYRPSTAAEDSGQGNAHMRSRPSATPAAAPASRGLWNWITDTSDRAEEPYDVVSPITPRGRGFSFGRGRMRSESPVTGRYHEVTPMSSVSVSSIGHSADDANEGGGTTTSAGDVATERAAESSEDQFPLSFPADWPHPGRVVSGVSTTTSKISSGWGSWHPDTNFVKREDG